jgi:hypothetical protein
MKQKMCVLAFFLAAVFLVGCTGAPGSDEERKSVTNLQTLIEQWHSADGGAVFEIEDQLFSELMKDPNRFYQSFESDSTGFDRFVVTLQAGVFTEYGDRPVQKLESKRRQALKMLGHAVVEAKYLEMNRVVMDELGRIKPTEVD